MTTHKWFILVHFGALLEIEKSRARENRSAFLKLGVGRGWGVVAGIETDGQSLEYFHSPTLAKFKSWDQDTFVIILENIWKSKSNFCKLLWDLPWEPIPSHYIFKRKGCIWHVLNMHNKPNARTLTQWNISTHQVQSPSENIARRSHLSAHI